MFIISCFIVNLSVVPDELRLYSRDTPSFKAYDEITWEYPVSLVNPYYVLRTVPDTDNSTVFSEENFIHDFEFIQKVISRFKTHTTLPPTYIEQQQKNPFNEYFILYLIPIILVIRNVISSSYFRGWIYKWSSAIKLLDETTLEGSSNIGRSYRHLTNYIVSKDQKKALTILYTNDDGGEVSKYLVPQIRELSKTIKEQTNTSYSLFGESVMLYDKWRESVESLPWVAIVSILIYFIAISVITLAPFLVFRFFVSGLLLFSFTLGFFVVAKHPAISFISFMMGFPFIQGAAFGTEVSAYSVLTHYKKVGFDLKSSVVREMYFRMIQSISEPIIGVVIFIPFACTSLPLLKDMGMVMICIFVTSLVFVQYLISPSLTMLWKDGNWWPRSYGVIFNQPTKTYDDSEIIKPIMDYVQKGINTDFYEENEN